MLLNMLINWIVIESNTTRNLEFPSKCCLDATSGFSIFVSISGTASGYSKMFGVDNWLRSTLSLLPNTDALSGKFLVNRLSNSVSPNSLASPEKKGYFYNSIWQSGIVSLEQFTATKKRFRKLLDFGFNIWRQGKYLLQEVSLHLKSFVNSRSVGILIRRGLINLKEYRKLLLQFVR